MKVRMGFGLLVILCHACLDSSVAPDIPQRSLVGAAKAVEDDSKEDKSYPGGDAITNSNPATPKPSSLEGFNLQVSCAQIKAVPRGETNTQVVCSLMDSAGKVASIEDPDLNLKWTFKPIEGVSFESPVVAVTGTVGTPLFTARFTFPNPASIELFYAIQKGTYSVEASDRKNRLPAKQVKNSSAKMIGEGCGSSSDEISFTYDLSGYVTAGNNATSSQSDTSLIVDNRIMSVSGSNNKFFIKNGGSIKDGTSGSEVIVLGTSSYTANTNADPTRNVIPKIVIASKESTVTAPATSIHRFDQNLFYCP